MADEKISLNKLFEETLKELELGMNDWIKKGSPIGHLFSVPVKNDKGGWGIGPDSPNEIIPHWPDIVNNIFGNQLENLKNLPSLKKSIQKIL